MDRTYSYGTAWREGGSAAGSFGAFQLTRTVTSVLGSSGLPTATGSGTSGGFAATPGSVCCTRAAQALMLAVRDRAVGQGRLAPSVDDVLALAHPVLRHRMALSFAARAEGISIGGIIDTLCQRIA